MSSVDRMVLASKMIALKHLLVYDECMKGIKLINNGSYQYIISASGKKAKAKRLEVGKTYLHQNMRLLRTITEITLTNVYYEQGHRMGCCSRKSFVALCPYEATEEEVEFLTSI